MAIYRKTLTRIALGLAAAVAFSADSADARGRGGFSRGRSGGISRRSSSRGITRSIRSNRSSIRTRINTRRTTNPLINKTRTGSGLRGIIGSKNSRTQKVLPKNIRRGSSRQVHNKLGKKVGLKRGIIHKRGHHHRHGHHHHHHWGGWFGKGRRGWGIGIYRRRRYFSFVFVAPVRTYCNPYCAAPGFFPEDGPAFDESQALQPDSGQGQQNEKGMQLLMAASEAFSQGDLQTALTNADAAAREMKNFPEVHQFRSLVLFAMGKYDESASAAHVGLTAGRGWNWNTLKSFYPAVSVYTAQLRKLEAFTNENPKNAGGRFLLAYHYLMMGHGPAAVTQLRSVVELEPKDELSARMLKAVSGKLGQPADAQPAPENNDQPEMPEGPENDQPMNEQPEQVEKPAIALNPIGVWKASRDDGLVVTLTMTQDGKFNWNAVMKDRTIKFEGQFVLAAGELKLTRSQDNNSLDGIVSVIGKDKFNLRIKGRDESDPGLTFERQ